MTDYTLEIRVTSDRETHEMTHLAAEMAKLVSLESDVHITDVEIVRWNDDDDDDGGLPTLLGRSHPTTLRLSDADI